MVSVCPSSEPVLLANRLYDIVNWEIKRGSHLQCGSTLSKLDAYLSDPCSAHLFYWFFVRIIIFFWIISPNLEVVFCNCFLVYCLKLELFPLSFHEVVTEKFLFKTICILSTNVIIFVSHKVINVFNVNNTRFSTINTI